MKDIGWKISSFYRVIGDWHLYARRWVDKEDVLR